MKQSIGERYPERAAFDLVRYARKLLGHLLRALCLLLAMAYLLPAVAAEVARSAPAKTTPPAVQPSEFPVVVFNRKIVTFRAPFRDISPQERARRASVHIHELVRKAAPAEVTTAPIGDGREILVDGMRAFIVTPDDADLLRGETVEQAGERAARSLDALLREVHHASTAKELLSAGGLSAVATAVGFLLVFAAVRLRRRLRGRLIGLADRHSDQIDASQRELLLKVVLWIIHALFWAFMLLVVYQWVGFVFTLFPYTRPWGEQLNSFLFEALWSILTGVVDTLPDVLTAIAIFALAWLVIRLLRPLFDRVEHGSDAHGWLDVETVRPTRRITTVAIWLFALAMAYPYLPGAQTEAFKGLSVLVGLMISIGASSLVGQVASGLILMYTRTLRRGEYVNIGEHEGTLVEIGMFSTRVRTGLGEELTLPNSFIMANVTRNFSRAAEGGRGYIVHTAVTIGYDIPWRQVYALLKEAARRTPAVLSMPEPRVFQTALSDFYVEYRVAAQATATGARTRAEVLTNLHANIQDVFNEHGVQIMSPHYLGDPATPKMVPVQRWHAATAASEKASA